MGKDNLLSHGSIHDTKQIIGNRHIVCLSGGIASAYVAWWVNKNLGGETIYYFNDTKWEHPDLYRFLDDLSNALGITITYDSDGRTPEEVFYDQHMLGSNRAPICSRILKAERLQKFVQKGDTLYFGIDCTELKRAARITPIYARHECQTRFPIIENRIGRDGMYDIISSLGVKIPEMYAHGFSHNNCHGGCVRAGKRQWVHLLETYPKVYRDRERVEKKFSLRFGGDYHFMKDMSLRELRKLVEAQGVLDFGDEEESSGECVGICDRLF